MEDIIWEKKRKPEKKDKSKIRAIAKRLEDESKASRIEKEVTIGFNADQFIVRLPKELSDYMRLKAKEAKEKKYKFKVLLDVSEHDSKDNFFRGSFEVNKNV